MLKLFFYILLSISTINAGTIPNWYYSLKPNKSLSQIIGYGEAKSIDEAKSKAREDIAKHIKATIDSTASQTTNLSNDNLSNTYSNNTQEKTLATLEDIRLLKTYTNEDGKVFVAMSYYNIPFIGNIA